MSDEEHDFICPECGSNDLCFCREIWEDKDGNERWGFYHCGNCGCMEGDKVVVI